MQLSLNVPHWNLYFWQFTWQKEEKHDLQIQKNYITPYQKTPPKNIRKNDPSKNVKNYMIIKKQQKSIYKPSTKKTNSKLQDKQKNLN